MLRRTCVIVAVLCLLCSGVGVATATTYTITDLGTTTSSLPSYVATYNGNLVTAGYSYNSVSGYNNAWYWTKATGAVNVTPFLPAGWGATGSTATGVNSSGQIVGMYFTSTSGPSNTAGAFVYTIGGTAQQITLPSNPNITTGVEGIGNITPDGSVPVYYGTGSPPGTAACPAVYNVNTQATTFPGGAGSGGTGYGVLPEVMNANDWIGGANFNTGNANVWNGSTWTSLPLLSGTTTDYVYGMNSNGDIVGKGNTVKYAYYAPYNGPGWGSAIDLFTGSTKGTANGINDNRVIVGATGGNGAGGAYVWSTPTTGSGVLLSTLVTNLSTWSLSTALGIDNAGDIVGYGTNPSGTASEAFLLTPTPEPSTLLLAALGLVGLLAYAWRKRK